jgi:hypothetical protein
MKLFTITLLILSTNHLVYSQGDLQKLHFSDLTKDAYAGWSVDIAKDYAAVGAPHHNVVLDQDTIKNAGAVFIFKKSKNNKWDLFQKIIGPRSKNFDWFGGKVKLTDNQLLVGCKGYNTSQKNTGSQIRQGAVFVYELSSREKWTFKQKISLANGGDKDDFGSEISVSSNHLVISAEARNRKGEIFIYEKDDSSNWVVKKIIKGQGVMGFGSEVCLKENYLLVTQTRPNKVFSYTLNYDNHTYSYTEIPNQGSRDFGSSLAITNTFFFIGAAGENDYAFYDDKFPEGTDSVFVRAIMSIENGQYKINRLKFPLYSKSLDSMGVSIEQARKEAKPYHSWEDRTVLKSGAGQVFVYNKNNSDSFTSYHQKITASDRGADDHFGMCIAANDSCIIIGAFGDKLNNTGQQDDSYHGAAYVFKSNTNGLWIETRKLESIQKKSWLKFGFSVGLYKNTAIIGSRFERSNEDFVTGGAYILPE